MFLTQWTLRVTLTNQGISGLSDKYQAELDLCRSKPRGNKPKYVGEHCGLSQTILGEL